jgi:Cu+-exporting ATPase
MTPASNTLTLAIDGMTCASCVRRVERALASVPGVSSASVNLATGQAIVRHDASVKSAEALVSAATGAVDRAGYASHPVQEDERPASAAAAKRQGWVAAAALGFSAPLVLPMLLAPLGVHWMPTAWVQWLLSSIVVFGLGARFFVGAAKSLRAGSANMDVLVALGTGAAWALSLWLWRTDPDAGGHGLYFESAAMVVALVLFGQWLEARARRRTLAALEALRSLRPDSVTVRVDGQDREVPLAQVQVGDLVVVQAGGRVPVDGRIAEGRTHVDESMLTGESQPVAKDPGATVSAGTLNVDGVIVIGTTGVGAQTSLSRIVKLVESAQATKPPVQKLVDRVAEVFVPVVVVIATLTLVGWKLAGADHASAIIHAVSVLVIACPCALGLATPAALMVGTGLAAQRGLLVREAPALEAMRDVAVIAFDKTGTLTLGEPTLVAVLPGHGIDDDGVLRAAAALQRNGSHPLAQAVRRAAAGRVAEVEAGDHRVVPGRGVEGTVQGVPMLLGSEAWMDELGVDRGALGAKARALQDDGRSVSWLAMRLGSDARKVYALGLLAFGDEPRPEAQSMLAGLRQRGVRSVMISGDNHGAAMALARRLGIDEVRAPVLPHDKARIVAELRHGLPEGLKVAMVGDGINDAPALAAADVGLAMGTGTDVAMETAGLTLMRGDLKLVLEALDLSTAVTGKVRQNLFWAFAYNVIAIPLAALGMLSPIVAGGAMAMSSVSVVLNALTLNRWRPGRR